MNTQSAHPHGVRDTENYGRLGVCPIAWVNPFIGWGPDPAGADAPAAERLMDEIAGLGFAASENSAIYPKDPARLREALAQRGLVLSAAYKWVNFAFPDGLERELEATKRHVDFCAAAGAAVAILAEAGHSVWDARGPRPIEPFDAQQWRRLAAAFDEVGGYARDRGIAVAVHPHGGTAIETPEEIFRLFELTDPERVGYCLDTGHVAYGGGEPGQVAQVLADRVVYVHLKDVRREVMELLGQGPGSTVGLYRLGVPFETAVRAHLFCPPGQGFLDFGAVFAALRGSGYGGWFVIEAEQDPQLHDPVTTSAQALTFLRGYGLAASPA